MNGFIKSLANIIIAAVTILSIVAIFYKTLDVITGLLILTLLLFLGFISLIIYYLSKLEKKIKELGQKFKRADELIDIKADINSLKLNILNKK